MTNSRLAMRNVKLTPHELYLGGVEHHGDSRAGSGGHARIFMEHGTYAVRGFDSMDKRHVQNFKTLTKARKFADDIVKGKVK